MNPDIMKDFLRSMEPEVPGTSTPTSAVLLQHSQSLSKVRQDLGAASLSAEQRGYLEQHTPDNVRDISRRTLDFLKTRQSYVARTGVDPEALRHFLGQDRALDGVIDSSRQLVQSAGQHLVENRNQLVVLTDRVVLVSDRLIAKGDEQSRAQVREAIANTQQAIAGVVEKARSAAEKAQAQRAEQKQRILEAQERGALAKAKRDLIQATLKKE